MQAIRKYRLKANLTQKDLAKKLKVSVSTVSMWETEKRVPRTVKLKALSAALGVSVDKLIGS